MKYVNAAEILPDKLLKELQKYIEGEVLYVPKGRRLFVSNKMLCEVHRRLVVILFIVILDSCSYFSCLLQ